MQFYRFILLFFFILSTYGCSKSHFLHILSNKLLGSESGEVSSASVIESETLAPPVSEDEESDEDDSSEPTRVPNIAAMRRLMIGAWKVSYQGVDCNMILTLTRLKNQFRGTARGCYGRLSLLSAWDIVDGNLVLKNSRGNTMIVLSPIDEEHFEGSFGNESNKVSISR